MHGTESVWCGVLCGAVAGHPGAQSQRLPAKHPAPLPQPLDLAGGQALSSPPCVPAWSALSTPPCSLSQLSPAPPSAAFFCWIRLSRSSVPCPASCLVSVAGVSPWCLYPHPMGPMYAQHSLAGAGIPRSSSGTPSGSAPGRQLHSAHRAFTWAVLL